MFLSRPTSGTRPSKSIATRRHTMYLMYAAKISVKLDTSGAKDAIIKKIQDPIRRGRKAMCTSCTSHILAPYFCSEIFKNMKTCGEVSMMKLMKLMKLFFVPT